jgi:hypothetical protein
VTTRDRLTYIAGAIVLALSAAAVVHPVAPLIAVPFLCAQSAPQQLANGSGQARDS